MTRLLLLSAVVLSLLCVCQREFYSEACGVSRCGCKE